jgi:hypothetical protein
MSFRNKVHQRDTKPSFRESDGDPDSHGVDVLYQARELQSGVLGNLGAA